MPKDLIVLYFAILCITCLIMTVVSTMQYNKLKGVDEKKARPKLIGVLINFGVSLISFVIILLNIT